MNDSPATTDHAPIDHAVSRFRGHDTQNSVAWLPVAYGVLTIMLGILLGPSMVGQERLAFRDVSHFYTPLYEYVAARQAETWLPLWNPLDLNGMPLAGETTTAVFYPLRILIYKLAPSSTVAIAWYVTMHLLIASAAIHIAAKSASASRFGCAVAVIVYPLAGPILFLIYNPPFLVGAAWAPLAIAGGVRSLHHVSFRWIAITSASLAMPILGGDPQTTIHVLMIGGITSLIHFARSVRHQQARVAGSLAALVASVLLGAAIAAPQIVSSVDWGMQSGRLAGTMTSERYDFSVSPWHCIELIISNVSGQLFPTNTRLSNAFLGVERTWVVTLYAGIIAFILCIDRYKTHGLRRFDLWDWLIPIGLLFSMTWPYGLLVNTIPGYEAFRYPAKWLSFVSLGFGVVAARHIDGYFTSKSGHTCWVCATVIATSLAVAMCTAVARTMGVENAIESLQITDRFWGPLRVDLALKGIVWSALATTGIAIAFWLLVKRAELQRIYPVARLAILGIISLDLFLSARLQIATVSIEAEKRILDSMIVDRSDDQDFQRGLRIADSAMWPQQWRSRHDGKDRFLEVEASQRATNFGRWHLTNRTAIFNSAVSIVPQRIDLFWDTTAQMPFNETADHRKSWSRIEQWLGIDNETKTSTVSLPSPTNRDLTVTIGNRSRSELETKLHRWDERWRRTNPSNAVSAEAMRSRLAEITTGSSVSSPIVEDSTIVSGEFGTAPSLVPAPTIKLITDEQDLVMLQVSSQRAGLLTLKTFQDGHWHVKLRETGATHNKIIEPKRTDFLFMSVEIPAGDWQVTWFYRPWWLSASLAVAAFATFLASIALFIGPVHH